MFGVIWTREGLQCKNRQECKLWLNRINFRPNVWKYKLLFSSKKKSELIKLNKFINHINKTVCTPA